MCGGDTIRISKADNGFVINWDTKTEGKHGPDYKENRRIAKTPDEVMEALRDALGKAGKSKKGKKKGVRVRNSRVQVAGSEMKAGKRKKGYKR